jgi:biotin carboxyl carrier protein
MMQIHIEGHAPIAVEQAKDGWRLNGAPFSPDLLATSPSRFHILHEGRSHEVELVSASGKEFVLKVNGRQVAVAAKDRFDLLLEQLGMSAAAVQKANDLKAPMPGMVLDVLAKPGDAVAKGTPLLVLEAMKMENVLKAPADVVVKAVKVEKRQNVEKGHVLLLFE